MVGEKEQPSVYVRICKASQQNAIAVLLVVWFWLMTIQQSSIKNKIIRTSLIDVFKVPSIVFSVLSDHL